MHAILFNEPIENNFIGHIMAEVYRDRVYAPFLEGKKDLTILDIGANIGITSYYFSQFAKDVYSVEPSLEHFDILTRMLEFNHIKNVHPINKAVYMKEGQLPLFNNPNKTMKSLHQAVSDGTPPEMVDCITLQGLMDQNKIEKVDFMKIDTEGSEVEILSNTAFRSVSPRIKTIVGEYHDWSGRHENQIKDALESAGYTFSWIPNQAHLFLAERK